MTADRPITEPRTEAIYAEHRLCGKPYAGCYSHNSWRDHCRADGMAWPCDVETLQAEAAQGAAPLTMSASIPPDLAERWGMCAECSHSPGNHGGVILRTPGKPCYVRDCKCPGYERVPESED